MQFTITFCIPCVSLTLCCFMVDSTRRFILSVTLCYFVLVLFSPFSIAIISLGEEWAHLGAFRTFVRFALVWFCLFPLPLGVWEGLWLVIVTLPGLFSYHFFKITVQLFKQSKWWLKHILIGMSVNCYKTIVIIKQYQGKQIHVLAKGLIHSIGVIDFTLYRVFFFARWACYYSLPPYSICSNSTRIAICYSGCGKRLLIADPVI